MNKAIPSGRAPCKPGCPHLEAVKRQDLASPVKNGEVLEDQQSASPKTHPHRTIRFRFVRWCRRYQPVFAAATTAVMFALNLWFFGHKLGWW